MNEPPNMDTAQLMAPPPAGKSLWNPSALKSFSSEISPSSYAPNQAFVTVARAVFNTLQLKSASKVRIGSASSREAIGQMLTEYPPSACPSPWEALREHRGTEPRSSWVDKFRI